MCIMTTIIAHQGWDCLVIKAIKGKFTNLACIHPECTATNITNFTGYIAIYQLQVDYNEHLISSAIFIVCLQ